LIVRRMRTLRENARNAGRRKIAERGLRGPPG